MNAKLKTKQKMLVKLIDGELKSKGDLTKFCIANTTTAALRTELAELVLPLCRTKEQRDAKHDDSRRFYTLRNTLNNPQRMGKGKAYTIGTANVDKDSDGNLTQAPSITKSKGTGVGTKQFDRASAMALFSTWLESQNNSFLGALLESSDTEIKGKVNSVYERQSNKARAKAGNAQKGKARAATTAKKVTRVTKKKA